MLVKRLVFVFLVLAMASVQFWSIAPARAQIFAPDMNVSPNFVTAGGTITVDGNRWTSFAAVSVSVQLGGNILRQTVAASGFGTWATTFGIPASTPPGSYRVIAQVSTFTPQTAMFTVVGGARAPVLTTLPHTVSPGNILTVNGTGFTPFSAVRVAINVNPLQTQLIAANGQGAFSARFAIPAGTPTGIYRASAQVSSFTPIFIDFTVQQGASAYAYPNPVARGGALVIVGTHWPAGSAVRVTVQFPAVQTLVVGTNGQGAFFTKTIVPNYIPPGRYDIIVQVGTSTPFDTDFWVR
jgi:hypothetical protein